MMFIRPTVHVFGANGDAILHKVGSVKWYDNSAVTLEMKNNLSLSLILLMCDCMETL